MQRTIRSLVLALALLVLAAGAVHGRPLAVRSAPAGFLDGLWQWVLAHSPGWTKEGGTMDPNGYTTKEGSSMDPNGARPSLPAPLPTADAGSTMDPDGRQ